MVPSRSGLQTNRFVKSRTRLEHCPSPPHSLLGSQVLAGVRQGAGRGTRQRSDADWGQRPAAARLCPRAAPVAAAVEKGWYVGSVIKKRRKRMAKKKHRKLLKKTRVQRRKLGK